MNDDVLRYMDMDYAMNVVSSLRDMGTAKDLDGAYFGFRGSGSRSAKEASRYVRDEMVRIGLDEVSLEEFPVDSWEFRGAWVEVPGLGKMQAASFSGSRSTNGEITTEIVDLGNGRRSDYHGKDVKGKIVLVNWHTNHDVGCIVMEAGVQGAAAVVLTTYDSLYGKAEGALQCHDGIFKSTYPPVLSIAGRDGLAIADHLKRSKTDIRATVRSDIVQTSREDGGSGMNVVGYLPGERWGSDDDELLIIGDHTDAWFFGACDNNTGVAAVLVLADAFKRYYEENGSRPRRTIVFIAHEAEESGVLGTYYTWLWGAWYAIANHHPDWVGRAVAGLFVDIVGFRGHPLSLEMTSELTGFTLEVLKAHSSRLPHGYDLHKPCTLTDLWPYAISGISCVTLTDWSEDYLANYYHSQYDDLEVVDKTCLSAAFSVLADMAFSLANAVVPPFDFADTAKQMSGVLKEEGERSWARLKSIDIKRDCGIAPSLEGLASSCEIFMERTAALNDALNARQMDVKLGRQISRMLIGIQASLGSSLIAMKTSGESGFPHEQSVLDIVQLDNTIEALSEDEDCPERLGHAIESLSRVGLAGICTYVSEEAYREAYELFCGNDAASWGTASHLLPAVDVWSEHARLCEMRNSGTYSDTDIDEVASSLSDKLVNSASPNLRKSVTTMQKGLSDADGQMRKLLSLIKEGGAI
jgi:N-acetylated-alpha-linked acidic dipeptidase